jgi:multidrug efflux system outer membrane protein
LRLSNTKRVKHVTARAIVCSMLLVLPSCALMPKLRQAEPGPDLPASFNGATGSENSSQLGIEEFFNDSILTGLIDQGLVGNRELKILDEEVQIARNEILARQGAYLPFVSFGANAGLDRPSLFTPLGAAEKELTTPTGRHFPDPLGNFQLGFNFLWHLDIWRELRNARDAAAQRYLAATERRNYFVTRLIAEIAENYYGLMALDKRLENLDRIIGLQEESLKIAKARVEAARGTELAVQRFQAEVRKNQSEKLIVKQEIVEVENRINFLVNRFPQPVERMSAGFFDLTIPLSVGVPAELLQNRPDIRQAEREVEAAGLDVRVARAHFFPKLDITAGVGYQVFNPTYFFRPEALAYNVAGNLVAPLINLKAIKAEYRSANARQLQSVYNYQRVILNAFTEVINRLSMVENYSKSIEIKKQQLKSLEASVGSASKLFLNARVEYVEVLLAQRDLMDARMVLIDTKKQQLSAIVNAYQALGGGVTPLSLPRERPAELLPPPE